MRILALNILGLFVSGCGFGQSPVDLMSEEIASFRESYRSKNYEAIYSNSSAGFKQNVGASTFEEGLQQLYVDMGRYLKADFRSGSSSSSVKNTHAWVILNSQFERGNAVEKFAFVLEDGKYRLHSYEHWANYQLPEQGDTYFSIQPVPGDAIFSIK